MTEAGGEVVFDVSLTVISAGAGAAGSIRHVEKLNKLKPLLAKLKALLNRKLAKGNNSGQHDHELKSSISLINPHKGLHNREGLTPDFETSANSFKTSRQVDMDNLSEADIKAHDALKAQGWPEWKTKEVLSSGDNFITNPMNKGDKLHSFVTGGRGNSQIDNKAYWLDEDALADVKEKYFREGHWDREGVKGYLALPCFNQANDMISVELTESQAVLDSTIGKASELLKYDGADGYTTGTLGKIMSGGGTQITPDANLLKLLPGK